MDKENKSGWYLDARESVQKIPVIREVRSMMIDAGASRVEGAGLKEAKDLVVQAGIGPVMLTARLFKWTSRIAVFADLGAVLEWRGIGFNSKEGVLKDLSRVHEFGPSVQSKLRGCSVSVLKALSRFYGIKGRGRMNGSQLEDALVPQMAYSEAVNEGIVDQLIQEAVWVSNRQKAE